jgi:iron complex transport system substrate-binding protein
MRIVSLLPSATEIVYALGLDDHLVGVTHECDWPPQARTVQVVSHSALPPSPNRRRSTASSPPASAAASRSTGSTPTPSATCAPTSCCPKDLCAVCAVPPGHVNAALETLGCQAEVVSLDPSSLEDVLDGVLQVGKVAGVEQRAEEVVGGLRRRLASVQAAADRLNRPRVFARRS